jgi:Ni,Fe-hydrogenase I small subunit
MQERTQMTVGELIQALSQYSAAALVWLEGCDCTGKASHVTEYNAAGELPAVHIRRTDGM